MLGIHQHIIKIIFNSFYYILFFPIYYYYISMDLNNHNFKNLLSDPVNFLIDEIITCVTILSPIKDDFYKRNVKYTLKDYVIGIIDVVKNYTSWNKYNGSMNGNTLRKKNNEWLKLGVYDLVYENSLKKYLKTTRKTEELKYQSIDSTFVEDINGCKDAAYNNVYRRRKNESSKGIKITSITTTNGIPLSINVDSGNKYDSTLLPDAINKLTIKCNTKKYQNHNRYKQYFLADSGYDSKKNYNLLIKKGYNTIIIQNKRNILDKNKLRILNEKQKKIYKKRNIIENYHSWIKKFPKIKSLYERNINNYKGLLLIAVSIIINRRTLKNKSIKKAY